MNSDGVLSFQKTFQLPASIHDFPDEGRPLIAPFWHHTTLWRGQVFYRQTNAPDIILYAKKKVRKFFPTQKEFNPTDLFLATWHHQTAEEVRLRYYSNHKVYRSLCTPIHQLRLLDWLAIHLRNIFHARTLYRNCFKWAFVWWQWQKVSVPSHPP